MSFDIPFPANYGGVIDVYFKVKSLSEAGIGIILHCFYKDRIPSNQLESICEKVYYYRRNMAAGKMLSRLPFIVESRRDPKLVLNLNDNNFPILFEGIHTTYCMKEMVEKKRKCIVRTHNVEHDYYSQLALAEKSIKKKLFFKTEAKKLENYEPILQSAFCLLSISSTDKAHFENLNNNVFFIPPFHQEDFDVELEDVDDFALYHANFEVNENLTAAEFLINEVFDGLEINLILAGKGAQRLQKMVEGNSRIELIKNPSEKEMDRLAYNAKVHVLPTFQNTGYKLKLLYSLYTAKSIIVNTAMTTGTGLDEFVTIAENPEDWKKQLMAIVSAKELINELPSRLAGLKNRLSNELLASRIIQLLE